MQEKKTPKESREEKSGSWKSFKSFFTQVKLSWGLIVLSLAFSIVYYVVVSYIPGSTAALYAGEFTTAAIMGVVIKERLDAILCRVEFAVRERDFGGYPTGLVNAMTIIESWVYGGEPTSGFSVNECVRELRDEIKEDKFIAYLDHIFLENDHCASVLMTPSETLMEKTAKKEKNKLTAFWVQCDDAARKAVWDSQLRLKAWQEIPNTQEQIGQLPGLSITDIDPKPQRVSLKVLSDGTLWHHADTRGICYLRTLILAMGVMSAKLLDGEKELLGRGVSYCATCDGGLYKGKTIAVICNSPKYEHEVEYLAELAAKVYYFPTFESTIKRENIILCKDKPIAVCGEKRVNAITLKGGEQLEVDGVFCLRNAIAPTALIKGIREENGHIAVDRGMATNMEGCFAAGDCTGHPYQYTKAVGEGNVAAHSAISYLAESKKY